MQLHGTAPVPDRPLKSSHVVCEHDRDGARSERWVSSLEEPDRPPTDSARSAAPWRRVPDLRYSLAVHDHMTAARHPTAARVVTVAVSDRPEAVRPRPLSFCLIAPYQGTGSRSIRQSRRGTVHRSAESMRVPMMGVGVVGVRVFNRFMPVRVGVRLLAVPLRPVPMLMVRVVRVLVRVRSQDVAVPMLVPSVRRTEPPRPSAVRPQPVWLSTVPRGRPRARPP